MRHGLGELIAPVDRLPYRPLSFPAAESGKPSNASPAQIVRNRPTNNANAASHPSVCTDCPVTSAYRQSKGPAAASNTPKTTPDAAPIICRRPAPATLSATSCRSTPSFSRDALAGVLDAVSNDPSGGWYPLARSLPEIRRSLVVEGAFDIQLSMHTSVSPMASALSGPGHPTTVRLAPARRLHCNTSV
ncbi:hypothetical protein SAMN05192539_100761 [Paraburkholderia diazotrophica]|uniref:Uncharacterized protein n=1 Tax=Paraburkholderia diazotrophica TaxID=667676 RepID=A0A1H6WCG0_9BURK|nr:hypothetical protein SAMN05192539_100761 [Paraburkholderia diazotrophica]